MARHARRGGPSDNIDKWHVEYRGHHCWENYHAAAKCKADSRRRGIFAVIAIVALALHGHAACGGHRHFHAHIHGARALDYKPGGEHQDQG